MSKKMDEVSEKRSRLRAVINKINAKNKKTVITFANETPNPYFLRYPTGCMTLDLDLGGGWPAGGMSTVTGPDGAGKTMLLYRTMAMHQRIFGSLSAIALAPVEFLPDYFFMRHCGVDIAIPDEMIDQAQNIRKERGISLLTKEDVASLKSQTGEFYIIRGNTGEEVLDHILDCYGSKEFGIIGLDSINAFQTAVEAGTESLGDSVQQASQASLLTKFCHRFHPMTMGLDGLNPTALLCTGQVRANRDRANAPGPMQKYIKQYTEILPWSIRHSRLIGLMVWPGEKIRETKGQNKGDQLGRVMNWETLKGKAGTHDGIRGETDFAYENLLNDSATLLQCGIQHGAIQEQSGELRIIRPEDGEIVCDGIDGKADFVERLKETEFDLAVRREVLAAAGKTCTYR